MNQEKDTAMRMIFVNLPVRDLDASMSFFTALGFTFSPEFSDDQAACMVVDDNVFVTLLAEERFRDFINGQSSDATRTTEVLTCLPTASRQQVDGTLAKAIAAGGKPWQPAMDETPIRGPIDSQGSFCRDYRCGNCGAQAMLYTARDHKTHVVVPHHRDCELWRYVFIRWPKLAWGIRHNL